MNQKGSTGIFIIIGLLAVIFFIFLFSRGYFDFQKTATNPNPSPTPYTFSSDPKYEYVKDKYNLSEEQLQILSTVNPEDNE